MTRDATVPIPDSQPLPGREQVKNRTGGYVFKADPWATYAKFLLTGTDGGTYYARQPELTQENAALVFELLKIDGPRVVNVAVDFAAQGRAPRRIAIMFSLAAAAARGDEVTKAAVYRRLPEAAFIPTDFFAFLTAFKALGTGKLSGRGIMRAIARWYFAKDPRTLGYHLAKYVRREGMTHRDAIRAGHPFRERGLVPIESEAAYRELFEYATFQEGSGSAELLTQEGGRHTNPRIRSGPPRVLQLAADGDVPEQDYLQPIWARHRAHSDDATTPQILHLIKEHGITREMIPTQFLKEAKVWGALLERMPIGATIRSLGQMSSRGLLARTSPSEAVVLQRLGSVEAIRRARLHPLNILSALFAYKGGRSQAGQQRGAKAITWAVNPKIVDALDAAFYAAFETVRPTGKRILWSVDTSGSMRCPVIGMQGINCTTAAAAWGLVLDRTEPNAIASQFNNTASMVDISSRRRVDDVESYLRKFGGGTALAAPIQLALQANVDVDAVVILSDEETWVSKEQVAPAMERLRKKLGHPVKLVVAGLGATNYTVVDPEDPWGLNLAGLDSAAPSLVSEFIAFEA